MAGQLPVGQNIKEGALSAGEAYEILQKYFSEKSKKPKDLPKDLARVGIKLGTIAGQTVAPRIGPVPTRAIIKGARAAKESVEGKQRVYEKRLVGFRLAGEVDLDKSGISRLLPFLEQVLPGESLYKSDVRMAAEEKKKTGKNVVYEPSVKGKVLNPSLPFFAKNSKKPKKQ
jgi:hypothetical protein